MCTLNHNMHYCGLAADGLERYRVGLLLLVCGPKCIKNLGHLWVKEEIKNVICVLWERSFIHQEKNETLIGKLSCCFLNKMHFFIH